jgi:pimeloyl-ACP methyl ester carboxylesterase
MTSTRVEVPGGRLVVDDDGAGPPIILLHAWVADRRAWTAVATPLVAAGYRVIAYDMRGYGESTTEDVGFSHRADLVALMDALGIERTALVGNSGGGTTAFDIAIEFPERVVAVVGVGAGLSGFDGVPTPAEARVFKEYQRVDAAEPYDADALTDFEVQVWMDGPGQTPGRVEPAVRAALWAMARPLNEPSRVRGRAVALEPPANDRLADLRCPVLAVGGALDFSDVVQVGERLEVAAPEARAIVWPDVAHMVGMEQPDRLAATILDFLAPLDPWH